MRVPLSSLVAALAGLTAALAGCATAHAVRVRCDDHLVPINAPAAQVAAPVASTRTPSEPRPMVGQHDLSRSMAP